MTANQLGWNLETIVCQLGKLLFQRVPAKRSWVIVTTLYLHRWWHLWRPWNWEISLAPSARFATNCVQMFQIEVAIEVAHTSEWEPPGDVGSVQCYSWKNYGIILPLEQMGAHYCRTVAVPMWEFSLPPDLNVTTEEKREIPVELERMWRLLHIYRWRKCFGLIRWCLNLRSLPWPLRCKGRRSDDALQSSSHAEGTKKTIKYRCKFRKSFWGKYLHIDFGLVLVFNHLATDYNHAFAHVAEPGSFWT